jgi:hypothetical protein
MTISVVRPVRTGLRFCGHLIRMWFTTAQSGRIDLAGFLCFCGQCRLQSQFALSHSSGVILFLVTPKVEIERVLEHHTVEAQHPNSSAIHKLVGRLPNPCANRVRIQLATRSARMLTLIARRLCVARRRSAQDRDNPAI